MRTLAELYDQHEGKVSDKWALYLREYDRLFLPYRIRSISLLEIGIQNGGSLEIWSQFFANATKLVGCDINQACGDLVFSDPRISVVIGDACAEQTKNTITKQSKNFDLIIDDGSHRSTDIVKTFLMYFPLLREGGVFVVEDLHCSYWEKFEGGLFNPHSSMSFFKTLADLVNYEHWGVSRTPSSIILGYQKKFDAAVDDQIFSEIHSIEFLNSVCVIRKESKSNNELGERVVTGKHDDIVQGMLALSGKRNVAADQSLNAWSVIENSPAEDYENLNQAVIERDSQIANLNQAVTERDDHIQNLTNKIDKIRSSISWRVSAPVRWIGRMIRHIKTLFKFRFVAPKRGGGLKETHETASKLYQKEDVIRIIRVAIKIMKGYWQLLDHKAKGRSFRKNKSVAYGLSLMDASVQKRLKQLDDYKNHIKDYTLQRNAQKTIDKIVVYTAIANNYDSLKLPEVLEPQFDYVLFTNTPLPDTGVWQMRPLPVEFEDPTRSCRYVKTHPHQLLGNYDLAIWIDSNIMIIETLYPDVADFMCSTKEVAAIPHPIRFNVYEEFEACKELSKDREALMAEQIKHYQQLGFKHDDLIESNFMMFNLKSQKTHNFLDDWWAQIDRFSRRDQLSLNYVLIEHQITWHRITPFPHSARNHPAFAFVAHDAGKSSAARLLEALQDNAQDLSVDVVIPVYNALGYVKQCLNSLELYQDGFNLQVIVVNDASNPETTDWLRKFCQLKSGFTLIDHAKNQGYTKAVNSGLRQAHAPYVVTLNSDTLVTQGWLKGLIDCINSASKLGIVGPLSNAASWQSVPELMDKDSFKINRLPQGLTPTDFAKLVQKVSNKCYPKVNVINGFCFMIKREVMDAIGYMDEINFPIGYGEENDYCIRAAKSGFELAIADNAYVYHAKSKSFGHSQRKILSQQGTEALVRLHGRQQLQRLTHNLKQHPVLDKIRQDLVRELAKLKPANKKDIKKTIIIPELTASDGLAGSAYVRLIEPYINAKLFNAEQISIHTQPQLPEPGVAHYAIFQRSLSQFQYAQLKTWLLRWRQGGGTIIYDLDDDLLDFEGFAARTGCTAEVFAQMTAKIELILAHAECVTVSTQALKNKLERMSLNVHLLPNFLNQLSWPRLNAPQPKQATQPVKLGYIGTPTHSQDLMLITNVIKRLEKEYGDRIKVQTIGAFENQTPFFGERVKVPTSHYPEFIAWLQQTIDWDIGLIPLVDNTFNKSKSHIKFLEYAALDLAIICSKSETYKTVAKDRKNCLISENTEDAWYWAIKTLIENPKLRKRLSVQARNNVVKQFTVQSNSSIYKEILIAS